MEPPSLATPERKMLYLRTLLRGGVEQFWPPCQTTLYVAIHAKTINLYLACTTTYFEANALITVLLFYKVKS